MAVKNLVVHPLKKLVGFLKRKNAGEAIPKLKRELEGPLLADVVVGGQTYKRKPYKYNKRIVDQVQHEANAVEYINTKDTRKKGELNFIDDQGEPYYMNKRGEGLQYTNLNTKSKNNRSLNERREANIEDQTKYPDSYFKKGAPAGKDAHHIAGLEQWSWVYAGMDRGDKMALTAYLEDMGIPMGDNPFNRADLSPKVHDQLTTWMESKGFMGRNKKALGKMPLEDRMEYVQQVIKEYRESMEKMFDLQMAEKHGEVWMSNSKFIESYDRIARPEVAIYERSTPPTK